MVASGHVPPSLHEFALRDMAFSTSVAFSMARHAPGCQLSASFPDHVASTYEFLRTGHPGTAHRESAGFQPDIWEDKSDARRGFTAEFIMEYGSPLRL
jgi:hypothetical protein